MKKIKRILLTVIVLIAINNTNAQDVFKDKNNVANKGYDVVNYFTSYTAERGSKDFSIEHEGAIYYFVSKENLETFKKNPKKYLPQYDGYCAFGVAKSNTKFPVDPKTFRIDDGKLYLFYNDFYEGKPFNTMIPWINNEEKMEKLAEVNWKALKDK